MFNKKSKELILLLLQRTQLSVFRSSSGSITNLVFPPAIVQDLEIKDEAQFANLLKTFVAAQKITQADVVIVLDKSVYFSQEVMEKNETANATHGEAKNNKEASVSDPEVKTGKESHIPTTDVDEQRMLFVQNMPFTNVFSTVVNSGKVKTIIALNRELYEPIVKVFNDAKLAVTHIYPILVVAEVFTAKGFTAETAAQLLEDRDKFKIHNFLQVSKKDDEIISTVMPTEKKDQKRVLLLTIFFIFLLIVFVAVWWWSTQSSSQNSIQRAGPAQPASGNLVATQTPAPTDTPPLNEQVPIELTELLTSSESAALDIEIINASGDATAAQTLQSQLKETGFTSVTLGAVATLQQGAMIVSVQPTVSVVIREALLRQLQNWEYDSNFQESETQTQSILITVTSQ